MQYVVPRWQRRYCWGQLDIERLVEDLVAISDADSHATHYGGTLLTFPDPGAAGVVTTIRVVDGQQRLTTVSILLACIAAELGPDGECEGWTRQIILDDRLTNPGKPAEKRRKLRLQDGDEEEYRLGLEGEATGGGALAGAWRIAGRLVAGNDVARLLRGLERFRVVSIGLDDKEDPQQIFESLNATGRPLAASEKVKNWLLMGLPYSEQKAAHDQHWLRIERCLDAGQATERTDRFLRDVLRWRTGSTPGIDQVYDGLRRWAVRSGQDRDRPALCRDLARLAGLYGLLAGTAGTHRDAGVERELRHLREIGIDVHRPLTLRLLNDAEEDGRLGNSDAALAKTLAGIGAWTTRMWLADRSTAGMNRAAAELAHGPGPDEGEDFAEHWLGRIRRLRDTRVGVPGDEDVREGIRTRKAYGGSATRAAFAVLCELMEAEHREEAPARSRLTVEHVMPRKLTDEWRRALGDEAEKKHGRYLNRLANLTLSGDATNSRMGAGAFAAKRKEYRESPIGMTRRLAQESEWEEAALERRAEDLARQALARWPWPESSARRRGTPAPRRGTPARLRWRVEEGPWNVEGTASQMVLNVAAALLSRDPANARRLSGDAIGSNVHPAARYRPGLKSGSRTMRAVPGHEGYVLNPYERNYDASAERCRKMGERCGVPVEIEIKAKDRKRIFWEFLKQRTGGVPGQADGWRGATQRSKHPGSEHSIEIRIGKELLSLWIRSGEARASAERAARMRGCSWSIQEMMGDQQLGDDLDGNSAKGRSVAVQRRWVRDDEDGWPDAAQWIGEQCGRLHAILADPNRGLGQATAPR